MTEYESIGARIAVGHATVAAVRLLEGHSIESIVLKGPALAAELYRADEARTSIDVDLLVADLLEASKTFEQAGYSRIVDWTPGMDRPAWTHVKEGAVTIDLHRSFVGIAAPANRVWAVVHQGSEKVDLANASVRVPGQPTRAMLVALHAAQHGRQAKKPIEDLRRALDRFDRATWTRASELARELDAEAAFSAGLLLVAAGEALANHLGLEPVTSRTSQIRASSAQPTALGLDMLARLRGRERVVFVFHKLFPPPEFMRDWRPVARRGRVGLVVAYAYRLAWLMAHLPGGIRSVRSANREASTPSTSDDA